jgi:hypothetical protein
LFPTDILLILVQGNSEDLTLTAQENLFEYITVKVDQGILRIHTQKNVMATKPMKACISFKSIDNLEVSGGDVYYSGNPVNVSVDARGGSKIYKQ